MHLFRTALEALKSILFSFNNYFQGGKIHIQNWKDARDNRTGRNIFGWEGIGCMEKNLQKPICIVSSSVNRILKMQEAIYIMFSTRIVVIIC